MKVKVPELNFELGKICQARLNNLTKPQKSLGRLEELAYKFVIMRGEFPPRLENKTVFVFAADHGIAQEGVSAYPPEVTAQMVYNFIRGGAGINVLARLVRARVIVVDMGVKEKIKKPGAGNFKDKKIAFGSRNFSQGPAMSKREARLALQIGMEVLQEEIERKRLDLVACGDMGIANTTSSSAILASIIKCRVSQVVGRGSGIDSKILNRKIRLIENALKRLKPDPSDPLDVLSKVGGFEIGGIAGLILGCAQNRIPVMLDGFITSAAALIAYRINPKVRDFLIASHCSLEPGHKKVLDFLGLKPLLDLDLRLGEGTGACLGMFLLEAGIRILNGMATFQEAGVSGKNV